MMERMKKTIACKLAKMIEETLADYRRLLREGKIDPDPEWVKDAHARLADMKAIAEELP